MRATDPVGTGYPDSLILDLDFSGFAGLALIQMGKERKKEKRGTRLRSLYTEPCLLSITVQFVFDKQLYE
jgi:hypothetical protein